MMIFSVARDAKNLPTVWRASSRSQPSFGEVKYHLDRGSASTRLSYDFKRSTISHHHVRRGWLIC